MRSSQFARTRTPPSRGGNPRGGLGGSIGRPANDNWRPPDRPANDNKPSPIGRPANDNVPERPRPLGRTGRALAGGQQAFRLMGRILRWQVALNYAPLLYEMIAQPGGHKGLNVEALVNSQAVNDFCQSCSRSPSYGSNGLGNCAQSCTTAGGHPIKVGQEPSVAQPYASGVSADHRAYRFYDWLSSEWATQIGEYRYYHNGYHAEVWLNPGYDWSAIPDHWLPHFADPSFIEVPNATPVEVPSSSPVPEADPWIDPSVLPVEPGLPNWTTPAGDPAVGNSPHVLASSSPVSSPTGSKINPGDRQGKVRKPRWHRRRKKKKKGREDKHQTSGSGILAFFRRLKEAGWEATEWIPILDRDILDHTLRGHLPKKVLRAMTPYEKMKYIWDNDLDVTYDPARLLADFIGEKVEAAVGRNFARGMEAQLRHSPLNVQVARQMTQTYVSQWTNTLWTAFGGFRSATGAPSSKIERFIKKQAQKSKEGKW